MSYVEDGFVVWPLLPNWRDGVRENLACKTEILGGKASLTGVRQKRARRSSPRRTFEFTVHPFAQGRRLLDNIENDHGARDYLLPIWPDSQEITADLALAASEIPCETSGYDFSRYALLRSGSVERFDFEVVEIDTVEADSITLIGVTSNAWPRGTKLFPLREARLALGSASSLLTADVATKAVTFDITEPCDWPPHTFAVEYRGYPVWDIAPEWTGRREQGFERMIVNVDNGSSIPAVFDFPAAAFRSTSIRWVASNRQEHALQRAVFYALRGMLRSLWVPSFADDLKPTATLAEGAATLTVEWCGYTVFGRHQETRRHLRIELRDGTVYYRRVISEAEAGANEVLTLDSNHPETATASEVRRISFMVLSEAATDVLVLDHVTDANGTTIASFVFEGVVEPPSE